ncbi:hypothetical protein [Nostocoides sp. HKS02]|uniref:hypothetical protein n=1 Tax=Nostocoides sp. HKS02 TaxID=1813880 RepID=UPI00351B7E64
MRSLPLSCVLQLAVTIDQCGIDAVDLLVHVDGGDRPLAELPESKRWWFLQDRLVITGPLEVQLEHEYDVEVSMQLLLPYLSAGPGKAAVLPFHLRRRLRVGDGTHPGTFRDVS